MNEHEEKFIASFIEPAKKSRCRLLLESSDPKRRREFLDRLNHIADFDERFVTWLPTNPRSTERKIEIAEILRRNGSPKMVYVMACYCEADGQTLPLLEAMEVTERAGWGTIISCIPGELAYYYGELGKRRAILERKLGR